ncbi:MAG: dienelactone hydrolase family protein, partial [Alphaproteobacteria bacterium]|nr:dienelactone hydrolase family protein [Alphaproteobacteria bacterium]
MTKNGRLHGHREGNGARARNRTGPIPLPLHLTLAWTSWTSSFAALPILKPAWPDSNPTPNPLLSQNPAHAEKLRRLARKADARPGFEAALAGEIRHRLARLERGIRAYRDHPYRRDLGCPPVLWHDGSSQLLDYSGDYRGNGRRKPGRPVLFVPSLINRFYVLDLMADRSLLRWMAARPTEAPGGPADRLRPMVLEWGTPGDLERSFTLTDYITKRLVPALEQAVEEAGGPVPVVGYCMGGLLAVAVAQLMPNRVSGLALLATPWDFHAGGPTLPVAAAAMCQPLVEFAGELPVYAIQALFATHDPFLVLRKFRAFADIDPESDKAATFVALEDWLNDGVALAGPVA